MEIEVSIDKFVIDYKDVPHSAFLRVYMLGVKKYQVKMKIYSGTYSYELHMRKSDDVYIHMYFKNFREAEGYLHTLRIETRPEHYSHFREILEMIGKRASRVEFVSCDVAYDIPTKLENVVVIPIDVRRKMSHCETTRYFGEGYQRKQNGYCRIYDKRLELFRNKGIYLENDLSRIEVVYKPDEKIELKDIERHSPKQNKQYFAVVIMDWQALEKKEVERVINLRDGKDMYTQYIRRAIKKPLANQYRVDFDELAGAVWKQLIDEPCSMVLGVA
ncbi:replication initiation protein [Lysinibacillus sp. G4S2]|uniref:replication initiation protein n=1 Tax=Lysinibacillus sp. G4S2 TaxID=3055859 RepID=UPI0025A02CF1|nr:replication initiation protein [Lysinibacillus sp. G4S2]MDM5249154.1 replication initiation protein [Lysinibacillus sp. G4S2]